MTHVGLMSLNKDVFTESLLVTSKRCRSTLPHTTFLLLVVTSSMIYIQPGTSQHFLRYFVVFVTKPTSTIVFQCGRLVVRKARACTWFP